MHGFLFMLLAYDFVHKINYFMITKHTWQRHSAAAIDAICILRSGTHARTHTCQTGWNKPQILQLAHVHRVMSGCWCSSGTNLHTNASWPKHTQCKPHYSTTEWWQMASKRNIVCFGLILHDATVSCVCTADESNARETNTRKKMCTQRFHLLFAGIPQQ